MSRPSYCLGYAARVQAELSEVPAEGLGESDEMKPWRGRVRLGSMHHGMTIAFKNTQVTDQPFETALISRRGDDGVRRHARAVLEKPTVRRRAGRKVTQ